MSKNLPPKYFTIHASATYPSMDVGADWIDKIHRERGFASIGYHYVIRRNGDIEYGRPIDTVGAHVLNHNTKNIGICLIGGLKEGTQEPQNNYTAAQWASLYRLLNTLHEKYPDAKIMGHNGFSGHASRGCPCFDWKSYADKMHREWEQNEDEPQYTEPNFGSNVISTPSVLPKSRLEEASPSKASSILGRISRFFK